MQHAIPLPSFFYIAGSIGFFLHFISTCRADKSPGRFFSERTASAALPADIFSQDFYNLNGLLPAFLYQTFTDISSLPLGNRIVDCFIHTSGLWLWQFYNIYDPGSF